MEQTKATYTTAPLNIMESRTLIHVETDSNHPSGAGIPVCSLPKTAKGRANADLIAAAPELLDALKLLLNPTLEKYAIAGICKIAATTAFADGEAEEIRSEFALARQAVAKALGKAVAV